MALRVAKSKGLLLLLACACGLLVFAGIVIVSTLRKNGQLTSQADMLRAAPETFQAGLASGVFTGKAAVDDVTAFHPAYLMGAISAVLDKGDGCKRAEQVNFGPFEAHCGLTRGTLAVVSNMMPQLLISVASNKFDAHNMPLGENGKPLKQPEPPYYFGATSYATIRYYEAVPDHLRVSDLIVSGLTAGHLADISREGTWLAAHPGLGFRTCYASKDSTGIDLTCYRG